MTDLIGGQIQIMFDPLQSVLSNIQGGKLRAIAVSSKVRSPALPDVPTIAESGYGGFETTAWWGLFGPAKLPADVTQALAGEIERIVRSEALRSKLEPLGVLPSRLDRPCFRGISGERTGEMGQGSARFRCDDWTDMMTLNDEEQDILAGKFGPAARQALQHQIKVGEFFGAAISFR